MSPITEGIASFSLQGGETYQSVRPTVTAAASNESVAADSGVFEASQENLKAAHSNSDLRSRSSTEGADDDNATAQVNIGLNYDREREMLLITVDRGKNMKELQGGGCLECMALYVKVTLLPGGESRVVETKLSNDVNNPVFSDQLSIPVIEVRKLHFVKHIQ